MSRRSERLSEEIKRTVSHIITQQIKDPRLSVMLSITRVDVSRDLGFARIFVSSMGDQNDKAATMEGLERAKGFIRRELGKRLRLRIMPEIDFQIDNSIEHGAYIHSLIEKVSRSEENKQGNDTI
jgi:ribosome-binding factor A